MLAGLVFLIGLAAALLLRNDPREKGLAPYGAEEIYLSERGDKLPEGGPRQGFSTVFKSLRIWHLGLIFACFGLSYVVYTIFFGAYLENNGLSNQETGLVWGLGGFISIIGSLFWGWLADRKGGRFALLAVLTLQGFALAELSFSHSRPGLYLGAMVYGLALWGMPVIISLITTQSVPFHQIAPALGMVIVFFSLGQVGGPLLAGWLKDFSGSLELAFLVSAGICGLGLLLALALKPPVSKRVIYN